MPEREALKAVAAARAVELVRPGTIVGLGTRSTTRYFIYGLARLHRCQRPWRARAPLKTRGKEG